MARSTATQPVNTFVAGLITEATELTQPPNSSVDEENCLLFTEGNRTRRRGIDFEEGHIIQGSFVETDLEDFAITSFTWRAVAGDGTRNFTVVQIGSLLEFYDEGASGALSDNKKAFTVDLTTLAAPAATAVDEARLQFATGKGVLFIASSQIDTSVIEYDPDTDTITVNTIEIRIRDFEGVEDGVEIDEEVTDATLVGLGTKDEHIYNLRNQGWFVLRKDDPTEEFDPLNAHIVSTANPNNFYPANNMQWFSARVGNTFDAGELRSLARGNTRAPQGHYIVNAFRIDRTAVTEAGKTGKPNLPVVEVGARPTTIAFFAGRIWYAGVQAPNVNTNIYFSQVLEGLNQVGFCYQVADPTEEFDPTLVDSDGGVVTIPEIGNARKLLPIGGSMLVFADNGVWQISGPDDSFKASDFSVRKITTQGAINPDTVINAAGAPIWWSEAGILTISSDSVSLSFSDSSLSEKTIQTFYNNIPAESKINAQGVYDEVAKKIVWMYRSVSTGQVDRFKYDKALWLDLSLGAFYPWRISELAVDTPYIASIFSTPEISTTSADETVTAMAGDTVTASAVIVTAGTGVNLQISSTIKYLTINPDGLGNAGYTFSDFTNNDIVDWLSADATGIEFDSFVEGWWELNGDITRFIQAPFLYVYLKRTEDNFIFNPFVQGWELENPSSLIVKAKWDWANSQVANRWSKPFDAYRFKKPLLVDPTDPTFDTGYPIVLTRNKIRGKGRALQLRFESNGRKDFNLLGWATIFEGNNAV